MRRLLFILLPIIAACSLSAQQMLLHADGPLPSFEIASIKPGEFWAGTGPLGSSATIWLVPTTTRELIASAYGESIIVGKSTPPPRIYGGPDWIDHDHYSTELKIPDAVFLAWKTTSRDEKQKQYRLMTQSLLAQRYNLKVHFEMREMPIYELHVAKGGLKLKPDEASGQDSGVGASASSRGVKMILSHVTMDRLCEDLISFVDRPLVNKTTVDGRYSFQMLFSSIGTAFAGLPNSPVETGDAPSIFSAIKDFGLELVPVKGPIEVVVIDSINRPTAN